MFFQVVFGSASKRCCRSIRPTYTSALAPHRCEHPLLSTLFFFCPSFLVTPPTSMRLREPAWRTIQTHENVGAALLRARVLFQESVGSSPSTNPFLVRAYLVPTEARLRCPVSVFPGTLTFFFHSAGNPLLPLLFSLCLSLSLREAPDAVPLRSSTFLFPTGASPVPLLHFSSYSSVSKELTHTSSGAFRALFFFYPARIEVKLEVDAGSSPPTKDLTRSACFHLFTEVPFP